MFTTSIQAIIRPFRIVWTLILILLFLTSRVQQISAVLVIILKYGIMLIKRALIITAKAVLVITRIIIMERVLMALEYKEGSKDRCYKFY